MKTLFDKTKIKKVTLKNRFVRSATWEGLADPDGSCNNKIKDIMLLLAKEEVALIISSHAYVTPAGQARLNQLGIYSDHLISGYQFMVNRVHQFGSKIIMQISHGGCRSASHLTKLPAMGPSTIIKGDLEECNKAMTIEDINQTVFDFKMAAIRAHKAGFDGIQIHAAHGYLLSEFLSPYFNHRKDQYGGSVENRTRIILDIINNIRLDLGPEFLISAKINSDDFVKDGFSIKDMINASKFLERAGIDAIELSGGLNTKGSKYISSRTNFKNHDESEEVYYEKAAELFKKNINIPLILVGGIRSFDTASRLIREEKADYIALSRPLIREPNLVRRWFLGNRTKSQCISCNQCLVSVRKGEGLRCTKLKVSDF